MDPNLTNPLTIVREYVRKLDKPDQEEKPEITEKFLSTVTDFDQLAVMRGDTSSGSKPRRLIEVRMVELVKAVTKSNIPSWFVKLLQIPSAIPDFIVTTVNDKAREIS